MIKRENASKHSTDHYDQVQEQVRLVLVKVNHHHRQRKYHLNDRLPVVELHKSGYKESVVVGGVDACDENVHGEHQKVSQVVVADTAAGEHAMVVAFQNAHIADAAVPGAWRYDGFADGAKLASRLQVGGQHATSDARVAQENGDVVGGDVEHYEGAGSKVKGVPPGPRFVVGWNDYEQFEPVDYRNDDDHE